MGFVDCSYLPNLVDTRSVLILLRKFQSFYIDAKSKEYEEELKTCKNPERRLEIKADITEYWQKNMKDVFNGLTKNGFIISFEGEKILVNKK